jgi:hypothetical protein
MLLSASAIAAAITQCKRQGEANERRRANKKQVRRRGVARFKRVGMAGDRGNHRGCGRINNFVGGMRVSNIYLHPAVCTPQQVEAVQKATGLVVTQSNRERNKIILVTPFVAVMRETLKALEAK